MIKLSKTEEVVVREIFKEVSGILDSKVKLLFANKDESGIYLDLISNDYLSESDFLKLTDGFNKTIFKVMGIIIIIPPLKLEVTYKVEW